MGTSNWQNISWCVQAIMAIEPKRALDIGVGYGRWGMLLHEFGDLWFNRVLPEEWSIEIEGIEAFPSSIAPYHDYFYNKIHIGDAKEVLFELNPGWDLVILGDVIEHFFKSDGERILDYALDNATYVLVNLPLGDDWPQEDKYDNPFEEHKAVWNMEDFEDRFLRASQQFLDFNERPFASVLLSKNDPKGLRHGLFGSPRQGEYNGSTGSLIDGLEASDSRVLESIEERLRALESIRKSRAWHLLNRARNNPLLWKGSKLLPIHRGDRISVKHTGKTSDGTPAHDLQLLRIESDDTPIIWDFLNKQGNWALGSCDEGAFGESLLTETPGSIVQFHSFGGEIRIHFQAHPNAGLCEIRNGKKKVTIDLQRRGFREVVFDCTRGIVISGGPDLQAVAQSDSSADITSHPRLLEHDAAMLEKLRTQSISNLAIYVPGWIGIHNSTRNLFDTLHPLPAKLDSRTRESFLTLVEEADCENLIFSGGAVDHLHLCREIHERSPATKIKLLWHGSFLQAREEYAWRGLRLAFQLANAGALHAIGFVKEGMEKVAEETGVRASLVLNYIPSVPESASKHAEGGPHFGLWISNEGWRKPPYAMAAAIRRIQGGNLHYAADAKRLLEFARLIGLKVQQHGTAPLSQDQLQKWMRLMHLNLYVTISECCPMLPLESLALGTPCLIGPNSHLFRDDRYLFDRLVVPFPDSSDSILEKAEQALRERDEIIAAYARYAPEYNERAKASATAFLES